MWIDKLARGVVELDTPIGPRYLEPTFLQRARLLWTFRNFNSLPHQVLQANEQRLIDGLSSQSRFVARSAGDHYERPIIGRVERRVPLSAEVLPIRKPTAASIRVVDEHREAASA